MRSSVKRSFWASKRVCYVMGPRRSFTVTSFTKIAKSAVDNGLSRGTYSAVERCRICLGLCGDLDAALGEELIYHS